MVRSFRSCAAGCGTLILFLLALVGMAPLTATADTPAQRQGIAAALRQIDALERLVQQSETTTSPEPGQRYHFDYPRLLADLALVRSGIQDFLTPSRAQPRDRSELAGDYRTERSTEPSTPEPRR